MKKKLLLITVLTVIVVLLCSALTVGAADNVVLIKGESKILQATDPTINVPGPTRNHSYTYVWKTSNDKIVSVNTDSKPTSIINAINGGKATVECHATVAYEYALYDQESHQIVWYTHTDLAKRAWNVTVEVPPTSITIKDFSLDAEKSSYISYTLTPSDASSVITWKSSNTSVATVNQISASGKWGYITAVSPGTVTITATTANGLTDTCTVTVTKPKLTLSSITPATGSTGVDKTSDIVFTYSHDIIKSTKYSSIKLYDNTAGKSVGGKKHLNGKTMTIVPSANLIPGHNYTVTVPANALENEYGNKNTTVNTSTFTIAPVKAVSVSPASGSVNVEQKPYIEVIFDDNIETGSKWANITLKDASGDSIALKKTISGNTLTIVPESNLDYYTKYTVNVPAGAVACQGADSDKATVLTFTTIPGPLEVVSTVPENGHEEHGVKESITVNYNYNVYKGDNFNDIRLTNTHTGEVVEGTVVLSGVTLTFKPEKLIYETYYELVIPSGALVNSIDEPNEEFMLEFCTMGMWSESVDKPEISVFENIATMKAEEGVDIYYSIDGSDPSVNGILYTEPVVLPYGKIVVQAVAVKYGNVSETSSRRYFISNEINASIYKTIYGDNADDCYNDVAETLDGGTIAVGQSREGYIYSNINDLTRARYFGATLVKYNASNKKEWEKKFGGDDGDNGYEAVAVLSDGGYVAVGYCVEEGLIASNVADSDALIVKYNSKGNVQWQRTLGGLGKDRYTSVTEIDDGYIAVGFINSGSFGNGDFKGISSNGNDDAIAVKYDVNGNLVWKKLFGGSDSDYYYDVATTEDGFAAVGYSWSNSFGNGDWTGVDAKGGADAIIIKYDTDGNLVWKKNFGGSSYDYYNDVTATEYGFVVAGMSLASSFGNGDLTGVEGKGGADAIIINYDTDGNLVWKKNFGGRGYDEYCSVNQAEDGYIAVGFSSSGSFGNGDLTAYEGKGGYDSVISKYDMYGNVMWVKTFGGEGEDKYCGVVQKNDGRYVAVGYSAYESFNTGDWDNTDGYDADDAIIVWYTPDEMIECESGTIILKGAESVTNEENFHVQVFFKPEYDTDYICVTIESPFEVGAKSYYNDYQGITAYIDSDEVANFVTVECDLSEFGQVFEAGKVYQLTTLIYTWDYPAESNQITIAFDDYYTYTIDGLGNEVSFKQLEDYSFEVKEAAVKNLYIQGLERISMASYYDVATFPEWMDADIVWSVSDTSIATINQDGRLSPFKNGNVTVYAYDKISGCKTEFEVSIVNVTVTNEISNMKTDVGALAWNFNPDNQYQFIFVPEGTESINLTVEYVGGTVTSSLGTFYSNVPKKISLTDSYITLTKTDADGMETEYYVYILETYIGDVRVENPVNSYNVKVNVYSAQDGVLCVAFYDGDAVKSVELRDVKAGASTVNVLTEVTFDKVKVMLLESEKSMKPLCAAVETDVTK